VTVGRVAGHSAVAISDVKEGEKVVVEDHGLGIGHEHSLSEKEGLK